MLCRSLHNRCAKIYSVWAYERMLVKMMGNSSRSAAFDKIDWQQFLQISHLAVVSDGHHSDANHLISFPYFAEYHNINI